MYLGELRFDEVCVIGEENVVVFVFLWLSLLLLYVMLTRGRMVHQVHLLSVQFRYVS